MLVVPCFTVKSHPVLSLVTESSAYTNQMLWFQLVSFFCPPSLSPTNSLISASASPVGRSWQYVSKSSGSDRKVSCRYWNRFPYLSHFLVCDIPVKKLTPLFDPPQTCCRPDCWFLCPLHLHGCRWWPWGFSATSTETGFYLPTFYLVCPERI